MSNNSLVSVPNSWKFVIASGESNPNLLFYLYNKTYFFTFCSIILLLTPSRIVLPIPSFLPKVFNYSYNHYLSSLQSTLRATSSIFFTKMKFKGKGYYVYKNLRNTIAPQFGYAHRIYVYAFHISVKFLSKLLFYYLGSQKQTLWP